MLLKLYLSCCYFPIFRTSYPKFYYKMWWPMMITLMVFSCFYLFYVMKDVSELVGGGTLSSVMLYMYDRSRVGRRVVTPPPSPATWVQKSWLVMVDHWVLEVMLNPLLLLKLASLIVITKSAAKWCAEVEISFPGDAYFLKEHNKSILVLQYFWKIKKLILQGYSLDLLMTRGLVKIKNWGYVPQIRGGGQTTWLFSSF